MSKFEKKFGKYAIKNLSLALIICYAFGYLIGLINSGFFNYLSLDPYKILHGQVWRLVTWVIIPPTLRPSFWTLLMLYFYYSIGNSLERTWGTYRYNVYLFSGMIFTIIGAFLLMAYSYLFVGSSMAGLGGDAAYFEYLATGFSTYYVNMSIFLAYAATYGEAQVYLFFILPIKVKVLGIIYGILLAFTFLTGGFVNRFVIGASLLNFLVFFFTTRKRLFISPKQVKRKYEFQKDIKKNTSITRHKCAICGRTEKDDPNLEFRFCSKCDGNYEYCQDHIYTHTHVKKEDGSQA